MAVDVAQPAIKPARTTAVSSRRARAVLIALAIRYDIHATGDAKRKFLIGYSRVFLQVRERQGGLAPLPIEGREGSDLESLRVHADHEILEFRVAFARSQLHRHGARHRRFRG